MNYKDIDLSLIVAMGKNREIGYKKQLLWRIKEDLEFFKKTTMNSYIIMGKNTYDSMPKSLPGRKYIVLSKNPDFNPKNLEYIFKDINTLLEFIKQNEKSKFLVVGGGVIYSEFIEYVNKMYITEINATYPNADTYFPIINYNNWYKEEDKILYCPKNDVTYRHTLYLRKNYK